MLHVGESRTRVRSGQISGSSPYLHAGFLARPSSYGYTFKRGLEAARRA